MNKLSITMTKKNQARKNKTRSRRRPNQNSANLIPGSRTQASTREGVPRLLPIPNNVRTVLKYSDYFLLTSTAGVAFCQYSGNSCFDPDITFTGHQPYYYDQYAALYSRYVVLGSRIRIRTNVDTGTNQGVMVGLIAYLNNPVPNTVAGLQQIGESSYGKTKLFLNNPVQAFTLATAQRSATMLSTNNNELVSNGSYRTSVSAIPTIEWQYKFLATNVDASTTSFGLAMSINVQYDVMFFEPQDEGISVTRNVLGKRSNQQTKQNDQDFEIVPKQEPQSNSAPQQIR